MKKRIFSLLLICCLVCALVVPAQAASASLSGNSTIKAGDSVVLTLSVSGSNVYGLSGTLTHSDNLTFTNYSCSVSTWSMQENGGKFSAFGTSATSGAILTVTLKASSSAKSGDTFSASFTDIVVSDGESDQSLSAASWSGTVAAPPSNNCNLDRIECYSGTMKPDFNKDTTYYTVTVPYEVEKLSFDYFRADKTQTVSVSGGKLAVGENTITFVVKAASGATKTYTLVATREQDPNYVPSSDASLKEMTVEGATLSPAFDPAITEYVAYVPFEQRELTLRGVPNDDKAVGVAEKKVELDPARNIPAFEPVVEEETGVSAPVTTYAAEDNVATLTCTAENGTTQQVYTVHIVRMPAYTGGVPQIHMTNAADIQTDVVEEIPEEEKPFEIPKTLELPVVGEMKTTSAALIGGAVVLVVMLLIGFLLGRIGRRKVYVDEPYDEEYEDEVPAAPVSAPTPVSKPAAQAKPVKQEKPAKKSKAFDFDEEEDEFERLLERAPIIEHKLPEKPVEQPVPEPEKEPEPVEEPMPADEPAVAKPAEPAPAEDDVLSHMSLDDLLNDIRNM